MIRRMKLKTERHLRDQGHATLDSHISVNPLVVENIEEVPEILKDDTAPSGNIGA